MLEWLRPYRRAALMLLGAIPGERLRRPLAAAIGAAGIWLVALAR